MLITVLIKSTIAPRVYPSRPTRVKRNGEITNVMILPAKTTEMVTWGPMRKTPEQIHQKCHKFSSAGILRQKPWKAEVKYSFVAWLKEHVLATVNLVAHWYSPGTNTSDEQTRRLASPLHAVSACSRCAWRTLPFYSLNHFVDTNEHPSSALIIGPWQVNIIGISLTKRTPQWHVQLLRLYFSARGLRGC